VKLLLDTHALIWFTENSPQLSAKAKTALELENNQVFYSIASIWEMTIKSQLGKLELKAPIGDDFRNSLLNNDLTELPILFPHAAHTSVLPFHHRDPFDRILVAQAIVEGLTLVSHDEQLDAYRVNRLW
jgi:PIN domain nuclease of toxin-antitoxin system